MKVPERLPRCPGPRASPAFNNLSQFRTSLIDPSRLDCVTDRIVGGFGTKGPYEP